MRNNTTRYLPLFFHLWNDLHIEVTPVPVSQLNREEKAESSAAIRERVVAARAIQTARFASNLSPTSAALSWRWP